MKHIIFILFACLLVALPATTHAQTFSEWFFQKKTQKKYLLKQIALLQTYLLELKQGYDICKDGLGLIHDIKNGEFSLHNAFYTSLKTVNPKIKGFSAVAGILSNELYVLNTIKGAGKVKGAGPLPVSLQSSIDNTRQRVGDDCDRVIAETTDLVTSGTFAMTDDARLKRITALFDYSRRQVSFVQSYRMQLNLLLQSQQQDRHDMEEWQLWQGMD